MNIITGYGCVLNRLNEEMLETVRVWRNSDFVKRFMIFKQEITSEMQKEWFSRVNNNHNYYFVIYENDQALGLVNAKDIDYEQKCCEYGIFLCDGAHTNRGIGARAVYSLLDFCFEKLDLNEVKATILNDNIEAINFNKRLGFEILDIEQPVVNGVLKRENYFRKNGKLREYLKN